MPLRLLVASENVNKHTRFKFYKGGKSMTGDVILVLVMYKAFQQILKWLDREKCEYLSL